MVRVLHLLSLDHAKELGVEVELLRAVRVRYKLPVDPRRKARAGIRRSAPWHHSRAKRRRIGLPRKPKAPPPRTVVNVRRPARSDSAQLPLLGSGGETPVTAPKQLRGDPSNPETLRFGDWKVINEQAKAKIAKQTRHIFTNDHGIVFHLKTRKQYTPDDLVAEFGLTLVEARSCFMTLDD